jgi:hypothetical protein
MVVGYTFSVDGDISLNHGISDVWLLKLDNSGNFLWEKCYGGSDGDAGYRIFQTGDNSFFILSGSMSSDGDISYDPYPGTDDYWIMKIDSSDGIIWNKIVGGNGHDQLFTGTSTIDGGIVALGWTGSNDGDISEWYGGYDMWLIKLDGNGEINWDTSIGTSGFDYGQAVIQTSDGGYLVGGTSRIEAGGNLTCVPHSWMAEAILVKLDANGNIKWQQCYGGSEDEGITGLLEISDGYLFVAYTASNDGDVTGFHGTPGENDDIWVVKTDHDGNIIWEKCFGGSYWEYAIRIFQSDDGGLVIVGNTQSHDGDVTGNHTISEHNHDIWIFKISGTGELEWQQCIGGIANETTQFGTVKKSDHDFVIAGIATYSPSFDVDCDFHYTGVANSDYWIFEVEDTTVQLLKPPALQVASDIHPNPADLSLNITLPDNFDLTGTRFEIMNITGQTAGSYTINSYGTEIGTKHLPEGIYILKLFRKEMMLSTKKFIVYHQPD